VCVGIVYTHEIAIVIVSENSAYSTECLAVLLTINTIFLIC
jgi:hypothetical protein